MERGSDTHSPRVDEQMAHEVAALVHGAPDEGRTEGRTMEAPGDEEAGVGKRRVRDEQFAGLADEEVARRQALARHLRPSIFPATRTRLAETLMGENAPSDLIDSLRALAPDRAYRSVQEVWNGLGGSVEQRGRQKTER